MLHEIRVPRRFLSERERATLVAVTEAALPAGRVFPAAGAEIVDRVEGFLTKTPSALRQAYRAVLAGVESSALWSHRRGFRRLSAERRLEVLESWRRGGVARRLGLRLLMTPLKVAHFDNPDFYKAIGCVWGIDRPTELAQPRSVM